MASGSIFTLLLVFEICANSFYPSNFFPSITCLHRSCASASAMAAVLGACRHRLLPLCLRVRHRCGCYLGRAPLQPPSLGPHAAAAAVQLPPLRAIVTLCAAFCATPVASVSHRHHRRRRTCLHHFLRKC